MEALGVDLEEWESLGKTVTSRRKAESQELDPFYPHCTAPSCSLWALALFSPGFAMPWPLFVPEPIIVTSVDGWDSPELFFLRPGNTISFGSTRVSVALVCSQNIPSM